MQHEAKITPRPVATIPQAFQSTCSSPRCWSRSRSVRQPGLFLRHLDADKVPFTDHDSANNVAYMLAVCCTRLRWFQRCWKAAARPLMWLEHLAKQRCSLSASKAGAPCARRSTHALSNAQGHCLSHAARMLHPAHPACKWCVGMCHCSAPSIYGPWSSRSSCHMENGSQHSGRAMLYLCPLYPAAFVAQHPQLTQMTPRVHVVDLLLAAAGRHLEQQQW